MMDKRNLLGTLSLGTVVEDGTRYYTVTSDFGVALSAKGIEALMDKLVPVVPDLLRANDRLSKCEDEMSDSKMIFTAQDFYVRFPLSWTFCDQMSLLELFIKIELKHSDDPAQPISDPD